jgi:hypothetical protein
MHFLLLVQGLVFTVVKSFFSSSKNSYKKLLCFTDEILLSRQTSNTRNLLISCELSKYEATTKTLLLLRNLLLGQIR